MFSSGDFGGKSPSWFLKVLKLPSFYTGNFKIFKNALGKFTTNRPLKHVIQSTNSDFISEYSKHTIELNQLANLLKGWVFAYEINTCRFEFHWDHMVSITENVKDFYKHDAQCHCSIFYPNLGIINGQKTTQQATK